MYRREKCSPLNRTTYPPYSPMGLDLEFRIIAPRAYDLGPKDTLKLGSPRDHPDGIFGSIIKDSSKSSPIGLYG